jgi:hypothetical protein
MCTVEKCHREYSKCSVLINCCDVEVPHNKPAFVSSAKRGFHRVPHTLKRTVGASRVNHPSAATQVPSLPSLSSVKERRHEICTQRRLLNQSLGKFMPWLKALNQQLHYTGGWNNIARNPKAFFGISLKKILNTPHEDLIRISQVEI